METGPAHLEQDVTEALRGVVDPETGVDVIRMRLVEELSADAQTGRVRCTFRPSSPFCPLAVHLALSIRQAIAAVPGVESVSLQVAGYVGAEELNALLDQEEPSEG
jgi:metal-sulfur cluster biosynthetic enzyme